MRKNLIFVPFAGKHLIPKFKEYIKQDMRGHLYEKVFYNTISAQLISFIVVCFKEIFVKEITALKSPFQCFIFNKA